ncbi:unnamed protein product, partial [Adineta steineri]
MFLKQSEFDSYSKLLDDPYETKLLSTSNTTIMTYSLAGTRELSSQMIETNKFGLPKCIKERNECQQIGIVGA